MSEVMLYDGEEVIVFGCYLATYSGCRYPLGNGKTLQVWYFNAPHHGRDNMVKGIPMSVIRNKDQDEAWEGTNQFSVKVIFRDGTKCDNLLATCEPMTEADVEFVEASRRVFDEVEGGKGRDEEDRELLSDCCGVPCRAEGGADVYISPKCKDYCTFTDGEGA